jgi:predicted CopG family antitoxin
MAVKTITIDLEAYALLARHKKDGASFSQVIKAHFAEQPTAGRLVAKLKGLQFEPDYLGHVKAVVRDRKLEPARGIRE